MNAVFTVEGLTKQYAGAPRPANRDLTFQIFEGEIFGLLGPNGAGKSTLVNQLAGQVVPTAGSIRLYDFDLVTSPHLAPEYVAIQTQTSFGFEDLYPEESIHFTGQLQGLDRRTARERTDRLMGELGLDKLRGKRLRSLSGGQRKLVSFARTLVAERPVLIFDEPTNELDPVIRRMVWDKLLQMNRKGHTIILVTHNVMEAERVLHRVGIVTGGQMVALGTPGQLKALVDQRVRLELLFKDEGAESYAELLKSLGEARPQGRQQWSLFCAKSETRRVIDQVLAGIGLDHLDDFRILTPTLEDVYLQYDGGAQLV